MDVKKVLVTTQRAIPLGYQGENNVRQIIFVEPVELLGENWTLFHQRAFDKEPYPVPLDVTAQGLVWTVTSGDTEFNGMGRVQLICTGVNGEALKNTIYNTNVAKSLNVGAEPPDPVKPWYDDIMQKLEQGGGGTVKSVNGIAPDSNGNVTVETMDEEAINDAVEGYFRADATGTTVSGYVNCKNGSFGTGGSYLRTDCIPVTPGDAVYYSGRIVGYAGVAGYDENKKFLCSILDRIDTDGKTYSEEKLGIPDKVKYIVATTLSGNSPLKVVRVRNLSQNVGDETLSTESMKSESYILPEIDNFAAFASFTTIGDSLTAGLYPTGTNESGETTWSRENAEKFCWPSFLAQLTGASHLNYGISGATAKSWCDNENGLTKMLSGKKTQAYIIGLGINDSGKIGDDYPAGTVDDINVGDSTQNADSFIGNYGKIVQNILQFNPAAKVFCLGRPVVSKSNDSIYDLVESMCQLEVFQGKVFFVPLRKWRRFYEASAVEQHRTGVHYSAPGYAQCAKIMLPAISEVMNENPGEFKTIPLIPYD